MTDIYGIDSEGEVTPIDVRNALVECFVRAHGSTLAETLNIDLSGDSENVIKRESIITFLKGAFDNVEGDFNNPTKEALIAIIEYLKSFSKHFRNPELIKQHAKEIMTLVNKLP